MDLTIKNVSYAQLVQDDAMKVAFIAAIRKAIASNAGAQVMPSHIALEMSAGSVVVKATIDTVAAGVDHDTLKTFLASARSAVETDVLTGIEKVAGIASIATGTIQVASEAPTVAVATSTAPTSTAPTEMSGSISSFGFSLYCSSGLSLAISLMTSGFTQ